MNERGRLPSFCLLHVGMKVRLTQTVKNGIAIVDATGTVIGIDFADEEPRQNKKATESADKPVVILRHIPKVVYVRLDKEEGEESFQLIDDQPCEAHQTVGIADDCPHCQSFANVVAVTPFTNTQAWTLEIKDPAVKVLRQTDPLQE